jgi:Flp pilus assembly protein TadB
VTLDAAAPAALAAGLAAVAVTLALPRPARGNDQWAYAGRLRSTADSRTSAAARSGDGVDGHAAVTGEGGDLLGRRRFAVSLLSGVAPVVLLGGVVGVLAGAVVAVVTHRMLGAREPTSERRRREQVARSLPQVVDLLAVTLASGASPVHALRTVANAVDGPIVADLRAAEHSLALGRDPVTVWREVSGRPGLAALGRTMTRAVETGASVSDSLHRLAEDLHAVSRLEGESRARAVGVRAAAPLGLCLLPAFVLVGVVPLVAGTVGALLAP